MLARLFALLATGEAALIRRRVKTTAVAYAALAVAAFLTFMFVVLAAYLAAAVRWGAIQSAIWFAVGSFVLMVLIYLIYKATDRAQRRARQRKRMADTSMLAGASAMAMLPALMRRKGGMSAVLLALAGVAGYAVYRELSRNSDLDRETPDE